MTIKGSKEKGKVKLIANNFDDTYTKTPILAQTTKRNLIMGQEDNFFMEEKNAAEEDATPILDKTVKVTGAMAVLDRSEQDNFTVESSQTQI